MSGQSTYVPKTAFGRWFDSRLPLMRFANDTMLTFPTPRNLNFWYAFGAILTVMLGIQIVTGIVLAMHYIPSGDGAFDSVENIMRDVNYGWLLRYMHSNGASMFFIAVYVHMSPSSRISSRPSTRFTKAWAQALRPGCGAASASATRHSTGSTACITCCRSSLPAWWGCTSGRCMCRATTIRSAST
jgi:hypothetical protein